MRLSRANIPLASEDRTYSQAIKLSSHYNLAPHFRLGFINLQHFCHSRWRNPVRLSKSGVAASRLEKGGFELSVPAARGPEEMTGDQMVAAMDAVGVGGAVLVSPFSMYRYDPSYVLEVQAKHPDRFCLVKPVDPNDPAVADSISDWKTKKGTVGVRILMRDNVSTDPADPGINRGLAAAAKHGMAVNLLCWGRLEQAGQM